MSFFCDIELDGSEIEKYQFVALSPVVPISPSRPTWPIIPVGPAIPIGPF